MQLPKHYVPSSTNSILNIIELHFNSLYWLDFLHGIDPFHILNLVVTKDGKSCLYHKDIFNLYFLVSKYILRSKHNGINTWAILGKNEK